MCKIRGLVFFVVFFVILYPRVVIAHDVSLPKESINPDNYLFYSFKRLAEKGIFYIKFNNQSKADYYRDLSLKRMAELKNVVDQKYLSEVQQSTQRLSFQVGTLTDHIAANKTDLEKSIVPTQELLSDYKDILGTLRDKYPANSSFWMLIQHSINSIDLNLVKLK